MPWASGAVVGVGEPMALFEPEPPRRLEDGGRLVARIAGAEMNALIAVARLGGRAAFVSAVGNDPFGRLITRTLSEEGVNVSAVAIRRDRPTGVFFKDVTTADQRQVYYYRRGSAAAGLGPPDVRGHLDRLRPRVLLVSGLTLGLGGPQGLGVAARSAMRAARRAGATVVFDVNLRPGIWAGERAARELVEVVGDVDVLLAGREELEELAAGTDAEEAAIRLCRDGLPYAVVKQGDRGATCVDASGRTPVPPVERRGGRRPGRRR